MTWPALPLFVRVAGRPVILLGEGDAAEAKRRLLERAGALVMADHPDARLAVVAIEDEAEAVAAADALRARGLLVNVVDRPALCDFTVPAVVDRAPVLVAIGTGGVSAGLAAALRQRLEALLPAGLGGLATELFEARGLIRQAFPDPAERRRALGKALSPSGGLDPLGGAAAIAAATRFFSRASEMIVEQLLYSADSGTDAGSLVCFSISSDDPDDLTLRQARALAQADRVMHTERVPSTILDRARADAPRLLSPEPPHGRAPGLTVWLEMA